MSGLCPVFAIAPAARWCAALAGEFGQRELFIVPGRKDHAQIARLARQSLIPPARGIRIGVVHRCPVRHGVDVVWGRPVEFTSVGDLYDNALAENLWVLVKTECIRGRVFATRAEANLAFFEDIDGFYKPPPHPGTARLAQSDRVRGDALRRPGSGRTSETETTPTRPDQLASRSRAARNLNPTHESGPSHTRCWSRGYVLHSAELR